MGGSEPWLSPVVEVLERSRSGVITEQDRVPWPELLRSARELTHDLPPAPHGWVVPADGSVSSVVALLAAGLAPGGPRWLLADPGRWSTGESVDRTLWVATSACAPPDTVRGTTYASTTSGTTGSAKLLFGTPATLPEAVGLYTDGMAEYAEADIFAACSSLDFAAAFYMVVLPALVLARDLLLFPATRWDIAARRLAGRPGVCLAPPALAVAGARAAGAAAGGRSYGHTSLVPAGGGLTTGRAERIRSGLPGCRFLTMLGSTETGLLTVGREVRDDGHVGSPLPGKPVWLESPRPDGVATMWTRGPDTRIAVTGGRLLRRADGATSTGDLAHRDPSGTGFFLDGRIDDVVKIDGVSVYPAVVTAAVRSLTGVVDAVVSVDRSGPADRITVVAVGDTTEERVRAVCASLRRPIVPHRVLVRADEEQIYSDRGKVLM